MNPLRYSAAAIQTDFPNPLHRREMKRNTARIVHLAEQTVTGYQPLQPVKLLVFPEFSHAAPCYPTLKELREKLALEIPNEHTEKLVELARRFDLFIQSGTMLELDPKYPGAVFNTTCLIGAGGILSKYRKVYPWIPWEVHTSPHDIEGYEEELFPVVDTPIGKLGAAICYDWLFPEAIRHLALNGAEVLIRVSAYMDPFGATPPMDWWTTVNRCRALENMAYVVASNQAASLKHYPPFSWPGGSMIVDFEGRVVVQATPGSGEKSVVGPVDIDSLRERREVQSGHHMLAHLRSDAHGFYRQPVYPAGGFTGQEDHTMEANLARIEKTKQDRGYK